MPKKVHGQNETTKKYDSKKIPQISTSKPSTYNTQLTTCGVNAHENPNLNKSYIRKQAKCSLGMSTKIAKLKDCSIR